jgi:hypothetical protein
MKAAEALVRLASRVRITELVVLEFLMTASNQLLVPVLGFSPKVKEGSLFALLLSNRVSLKRNVSESSPNIAIEWAGGAIASRTALPAAQQLHFRINLRKKTGSS